MSEQPPTAGADATLTGPPAGGADRLDRAGRYRLDGEIGRGGMGVVYRGEDAELGRSLAVKVLLSRHAGNAAVARRFLDEARLTAQLQHPGIPPIHEVGELPDGRPFFAMKLVKGRTLADLLTERTAPQDDLPRFLAIFEQVCQTVAYAHSRGVIHRDLKPSNVMVGAFGEVQVMDWGLAKVLGEPSDADGSSDTSTLFLTRAQSAGQSSQAGTIMAPYIYNTLGRILSARMDVSGALAAYREGTRLGDRRPALFANLADELLPAGRTEEARALWRRVLRVAEAASRHNPRDSEALAMAGHAHNNLGDHRAAEPYLRAALRLEPTNAEYNFYLGWGLQKRGDPEAARASLHRARDLFVEQGSPRTPFLWLVHELLGVAALRLGRPDEAVSHFRAAIQIAPARPINWGSLALAQHEQGDQQAAGQTAREAVRRAEAVLDRVPGHVETLACLGRGHQMLQRHVDGAAAFRLAIHHDPRCVQAMMDLASLLRAWNTPEALAEARQVLTIALRLEPGNAGVYSELSVVARRQGKRDEAVAAARAAVRLSPGTAVFQVVLANALTERGELDEAVAVLRRVKAARPNYHFAVGNLGRNLTLLGRHHEAVGELRAALKLAPHNVPYHRLLAPALTKVRDTPGAILAIRQARMLSGWSASVRELLAQHEASLVDALDRDPRTRSVLAADVPPDQAVERLLALYARSEAVLAGKAKPRDADEALRLARLCGTFAGNYPAATRLFADAFAAEPALAGQGTDRLSAILAAVQGAVGLGVDAPGPDDPARKALRQHALAWLQEEVAAARTAPAARRRLEVVRDSPVQRLRREAALRLAMPPTERAAWEKLLAEVDRLTAPPPMKPAAD